MRWKYRHPFSVVLLGVGMIAPAHAADQEAQLWLTENFSTKIDGATTLTLDLNQRARSAKAGGDQYLQRLSIDRKIADGVEIGLGATYQQTDVEKEHRTHEQITLSHGIFAARIRVEQRMFERVSETGWRLRERLQAMVPVDSAKKWTLIANGELFFQLNRLKASDRRGLAQFRTQIGLRRALGKSLSIQLLYLRQQNIRDNRPDFIAHAPLLTLNWRI